MGWFRKLIDGLCGCPSLRIVPRLGLITEQPKGFDWRLAPSSKYPHQFAQTKKGVKIMAFTMTDSQKTTITVGFTDKKGNPVTSPTGVSVAWLVDNPNVIALTPSADGFSCDAASVGPIGTGNVTVNVTDSSGTAVASGTLEIDVTSGAPATIVLTPGAAVEQ